MGDHKNNKGKKKKKLTIKADEQNIELDDEQIALFNKLTKLQQRVSLKSLEGYSNSEAYKLAGGAAKKPETIAACATEILKNPNVVNFIQSVSKTRVKSTIMSKEELLEALSIKARGLNTTVFDLVETYNDEIEDVDDNTGQSMRTSRVRFKNEHEISEQAKHAISGVKQNRYGLEFTMGNSLQAAKQLAELNGYNAPVKSEVTNYEKKSLNDLYDDE